MRMRRLSIAALVTLTGAAAGAEVWNSASVGDWSDPANWSPMSVPNGVGATAEIISTVNGGALANSGTFLSAVPITLGSLNVDMGTAGPSVFLNFNELIFDNGGGADVFLDGDASLAANIVGPITLRGDLHSAWTASNATISGAISGEYGIYHHADHAAGRLKLWGENTFTGPVQCTNGSVSIIADAGLGSSASGTTIVGTTATLLLESPTPTVYTDETLTLRDSGRLQMRTGTDWAGDIVLDGTGRIGAWFDTEAGTVSGKITGGRLDRASADSRMGGFDSDIESILFVTNPENDYTGGTNISGGILAIPSDEALGVSGAGITFNGSGFLEGPPVLATTADAMIARDIAMSDGGSLRAAAGTTGAYPGAISGLQALAIGGAYGGAASALALPEWTGVVELSGENTYTGATRVVTGTLLVTNGAGSATGTGDVTVEAEGTLRGDGAIAGDVTVNGVIAPGAPLGDLNIGGELALTSGSVTSIEILGGARGALSSSAIVCDGPAAIGGELVVVADPELNYDLGDEFTALTASAVFGTYDTLSAPEGFEVMYDADAVRLVVTSVAQECPADLDMDGSVGSGDLAIVLAAWAQAGGEADLDGGGTVGSGDLAIVLAAWGMCP